MMTPRVIPVQVHHLTWAGSRDEYVVPIRVSGELMRAMESQPLVVGDREHWLEQHGDGTFDLVTRIP